MYDLRINSYFYWRLNRIFESIKVISCRAMSHLFDFFNRHLEDIRHVCARKRENEKPILLDMDISWSRSPFNIFILPDGYSENIFSLYLHAFRPSFSNQLSPNN